MGAHAMKSGWLWVAVRHNRSYSGIAWRRHYWYSHKFTSACGSVLRNSYSDGYEYESNVPGGIKLADCENCANCARRRK